MISKKYKVITFGECVDHFSKNGIWPKKSAVITVDDGYRDFYQYAYPELKRLNLPATFFVTVNFVDQKQMLWHDRLHYAIENTSENYLQVQLGQREECFPLNDQTARSIAWKALSDFCIASEDTAKWELIRAVESALGVIPPKKAPDSYAPVTWEELREMGDNGIEVGCHTMNHPILSRIPENKLHEEIVEPKYVLEEKLSKPVCSFCYPNGMPGDINEEVVSTVRSAGYTGAPFGNDLTAWHPFEVPRMGINNNHEDFMWKLNGGEFVGQRLKLRGKGASK